MNGSFQAARSLGSARPHLLILTSAESRVPSAQLAQTGFTGAEVFKLFGLSYWQLQIVRD